MPGPALIAAIPAATAAIQAGASGSMNRKTIKANMKLAELAYQRQVEMFHMANEYNSPSAQMERLRQAGLNPNLVYGSGADNTTAVSTPQYTPPDVTRKAYVPDFAPAIQTFLNTRMQLAQIDNVNAATENIRTKTESESFNVALRRLLGEEKQLDVDFKKLTNPYRADILMEQTLGANIKNTELMQRVFNMRENEVRLRLENDYKRNLISQQQIDKEIKQAELMFKNNENELRRMGITSGDSWYLRALIRALNSGNLSFSDNPSEAIRNYKPKN